LGIKCTKFDLASFKFDIFIAQYVLGVTFSEHTGIDAKMVQVKKF